MGGCCCCPSREPDQTGNPAYYYRPRVISEEHQPLSTNHGGISALSTGLLVDTNLDTSSPDTYRPPPAPMPYDIDFGRPQTPTGTQDFCGNKSSPPGQVAHSDSIEGTMGGITPETLVKCEDLKKSDCEVPKEFELNSEKQSEIELSKSAETLITSLEEEDVCPTCLEEYNIENPKIITKCEHHFHLACILEWMERSDTCAVCDKEMIFSPPISD